MHTCLVVFSQGTNFFPVRASRLSGFASSRLGRHVLLQSAGRDLEAARSAAELGMRCSFRKLYEYAHGRLTDIGKLYPVRFFHNTLR